MVGASREAERTAAELAGQTVLITGASGGLGRALSLAFGRAGARLLLCARGAERLERAAAEARAAGADVLAKALDVRDDAAVEGLVRAAEARWKEPVGTAINGASLLGSRRPLREIGTDEWREVLDANLTGPFIVARAVLSGMRRAGRGSIINVTSGVGNEPRTEWGAYAVSKWGLEALTWNLAREERAAGIRVNAVDPGRMRTGMRRAAYPDEDPDTLPRPSEVVGVFLWLASAASAEVTGRRFEAQEWGA